MIVEAPASGRLKDENDIARRSDQRFAALRPYLPQHGVVGYIGEPGAAAMGDYYLTQYALAPLVLDHSTNHRFVVGNFPSSSPAARAPAKLQLVKDFGDGVLLFASEDAR